MIGPSAAQDVPEPDDYRMTHFRAPVPETVLGQPGIDADAAHQMWNDGAVFIDVLPRPPKPQNLPAGTIWNPRKRHSIPGAAWFPNTGFGKLPPERLAYLQNGLIDLTKGDLNAPIVIFYLAECWMSWNVVRRLILEMGYTKVNWFPGGTDDWEFQDFPTEIIQPYPGFPDT